MASVGLLALCALSAPAFAEDANHNEDQTVIIVTARSQAESLQETPVNIASIGLAVLETYQVNEISDVVNRIPTLNVQIGGSGAGAQISLRGIGSSNISSAFDSAVGLDFDGVQVSTQRLLQTAFFDVKQIDVLKGPQSLYFGKSASAGVISLKSADPTKDWETAAKGSYEFAEEGYTIDGYVSGPISNTLGVRVAAQYQNIARFVQLEPQVAARDHNKGLVNFIGRVTLQWNPSDVFSANLKLNYNNQKSQTILGRSDLGCPTGAPSPVVLALANAANGFAPVIWNASHSCNVNDGLYPFADGDARFYQVQAGTTGDGRDLTQPYNDTRIFFSRLAIDYQLSDSLTLSSVSGYVSLFNEYNGNFSYTGNANGVPAGLMAPFRNQLEQYSEQLRLISNFEGRFNFMLGAFWEHRNIPYGTSQNAFAVSLYRPDPITGNTFDWYAERNSKAEAVSIFGSATLNLTDQLELSGGVRWTDEHKSTTVSFPYVHSDITNILGFLPSGFFAGPIKFADSNVSPEVTLKYKLSPDVNVYAAFKTGFKSGGVDNNALPSGPLNLLNDPDPAIRAQAESSLRFQSETSKGGEIGVKSQFADRTITVNATAFYYVFNNLQIQQFDVAIFNFNTFNASQLTTQGIDLDWSWRMPLKGLTLSGAASYTDTKYSKQFIQGGIDLNGRAAPQAPEFSGNIAFDWKVPLSDSMDLGLSGNATYSDSYLTNATYDYFTQPSYVTLDASISVGAPDGRWKLSLAGTNLTDKIITNTVGGAPFNPPDLVYTQNRGRRVFVETSFKF